MVRFKDLADRAEDDRIDEIGRAIMVRRGTDKAVAFVVDSEPGKADRYIRKLIRKFPEITDWKKLNGPAEGTISILVQPPRSNS
jgi:hypothetical protein